MEEKKDWFELFYDSPRANFSDYISAGINPKDVELKSKDEYKKNELVQQAFTNEEGKFDEKAFDKFYKDALITYNIFATESFQLNELPQVEYDLMANFRLPSEKIQTMNFEVKKKNNPFISSQGVSSIFGVTESLLTDKEIAQSNKIWDNNTNSWREETPEDLGFWGTITDTPIALARYTEDTITTDPNTGRKIQHKKGELKLDENGVPYYETLDERSSHNRELLSPWDVLTREGSTANYFDFMDNDGRDKSMAAHVAQAAAHIGMLLIPKIGAVYAYLLLSKNLGQLGIRLYKMFDGLANPDKSKDSYGILNTIESKLDSLTPSTDEYSANNLVSFGNFTNLVADVFGQLKMQRAFAEIPYKLGIGNPVQKVANKMQELGAKPEVIESVLKGGRNVLNNKALQTLAKENAYIGKYLDNVTKTANGIGKWGSAFFMSGISTSDVYYDALDAGYDNRTAALTAMLAMAATTAMIGGTEIGQVALQGLGINAAKAQLASANKEFVNLAAKEAGILLNQTVKDKNLFNKLLRKAKDFYGGAVEQMHKGSYLGGAVLEGIEETSEELIMDISKELTDVVTGVFGTQPNSHFEFLKSNPLERYLMSAIGGAVGGAIFTGSNKYEQTGKFFNSLPKDSKEALFVAFRNGRRAEVDRLLSDLEKKGVAPKDLSAINTEVNGNEIVYKPYNENDPNDISLNQAVINMTRSMFDVIEGAIVQEDLGKTDDDIIFNSILRDRRISDLVKFEGTMQMVKDFNQLGLQAIGLNVELNDIQQKIDGKVGDVDKLNEEKRNLQAKLNDLKLKRDEIVNGSKAEEYLAKTLFHLSPVSQAILATSIDQYAKHLKGVNYNQLSKEQQQQIEASYKKYKDNFETKFNEAYSLFQNLQKKYGKELSNLAEKLPVLNALEEYLSNGLNEAVIDLNEIALKQFDIQRKGAAILGETTNRGLDFILNHDNLLMSNPEVVSEIEEFFINYEAPDGTVIGFQPTELLSNHKTYKEFLSTLDTDILNLNSDANEDLKKELNEIYKKEKSDPSYNTRNDLYNVLSNRIVSDTKSKDLIPLFSSLLNIVANSTQNNVEFIEEFNSLLNEFSARVAISLNSRVKLQSAKQLLSDAASGKVKLTKNLYRYIQNYVKPDNTVSFSSELEENLVEGKVDEIDDETFNNNVRDYGLPKTREEVKAFIKELQSSKNWFEVTNVIDKYNVKGSGIYSILSASNTTGSTLDFSTAQKIKEFSFDESKLENDPITDLLQKIKVEVTGSSGEVNIFELLENENNVLKSLPSISDYVIQGEVRVAQLQQAKDVIELLKSLVLATYKSTNIDGTAYGYNTTLNYYRDKIRVTEMLEEADPRIVMQLEYNLQRIQDKLDFFIKLSEKNSGNKLTEHRTTAVKTQQSVLKSYLNTVFTANLPELFEGISDITLKYDLEELQDSDLSDERYIELEQLITEIEDKIFENAEALGSNRGYTKSQILDLLFKNHDYSQLIASQYVNPKPLTPNMEEMDPSILYAHYHSILAIKSSKFKSLLSQALETLSTSSKKFFVPIYSQEFAARIDLSMLIDSEIMNHMTSINDFKLNSIQDEELREKYQLLSIVSKNLVFNAGAPGVGKTNGVGKLVYALYSKYLGREANVIISGPRTQQVLNLSNALLGTEFNSSRDKLEDVRSIIPGKNQALSVKDLIIEVYKDSGIIDQAISEFKSGETNPTVTNYIKATKSGDSTYKLKEDNLVPDKFNLSAFSDIDAIFIDEITHLSKFELEVLTTWAFLTGKKIICFGDVLQSGFKSDNNYFGIDVDNLFITTPTLATSLRVSNGHKKENMDALRTANERVYETIATSDDIPSARAKIPEIVNNIPAFKYHENETSLYGEKFVGAISNSDLDKLNKDSGNGVGYTYDDDTSDTYKTISDYNATHPEKPITMLSVDKVQGLEAKYFIVDLHLSAKWARSPEEAIKDLYTALTRSEEGTIIIDNEITDRIFVKGDQGYDYSFDYALSSQSAKDFADLRTKSLQALLGNLNTQSAVSTTTPVSKPSSPKPPSSSGPSTSIKSSAMAEEMESLLNPEKANPEIEERVTRNNRYNNGYTRDESFESYSFSCTPKVYKSGNGVKFERYGYGGVIFSGLQGSDHLLFLSASSEVPMRRYIEVNNLILDIKDALLYSNSIVDRNTKLNSLNSRATTLAKDCGLNVSSLNLSQGSFNLKAIKYDNGREVVEMLRVVYSIPDLGDVNLYDLPNPNNPNVPNGFRDFHKNIFQDFPAYKNASVIRYKPLNPKFRPERITNSWIQKTDSTGNRFNISFDEVSLACNGIFFSKPYIIGDYETEKDARASIMTESDSEIEEKIQSKLDGLYNSLSDEKDPERVKQIKYEIAKANAELYNLTFSKQRNRLNGRAVTFVTFNKNLRDPSGRITTPDEYHEYYLDQMSGTYKGTPYDDQVKMVVLNPNGISFTELYKFYSDYVIKARGYEKDSKIFKTLVNDYTGHDILWSIFGYFNHLRSLTPEQQSTIPNYKQQLHIGSTLVRVLTTLSESPENVFNNTDKVKPSNFHVMRILDRLHRLSLGDNLPDDVAKEITAKKEFNGFDVLWYLYRVITNTEEAKSGKKSYVLNKKDDDQKIYTFDPKEGVSKSDILQFMDFATMGKKFVSSSESLDGYNPLFKEGIYFNPVFAESKKDAKDLRFGDLMFMPAFNMGGVYYLDVSVQTPRFAFVPERDLSEFPFTETPSNPILNTSTSTTPLIETTPSQEQESKSEEKEETKASISKKESVSLHSSVEELIDGIDSSVLNTEAKDLFKSLTKVLQQKLLNNGFNSDVVSEMLLNIVSNNTINNNMLSLIQNPEVMTSIYSILEFKTKNNIC